MPLDHGRPPGSRSEEVAPSVREPTHAERCRTLAAQSRSATLCTIATKEPEGYPYGSLVTVAFDAEGRALLLLSELAEHTQNLKRRPDASLLVSEPLGERSDPLALARMTLLGPCARVADAEATAAREAFLAVHPGAGYYVDFKDFAFYRLVPSHIRYVGGYGRMSWVEGAAFRTSEPDPLSSAAAGILSHMNEDHADAMRLIALHVCGIAGATGAIMTAVDRYGWEMTVATPDGPRPRRVAFEPPVTTTTEVRQSLVEMVTRARAKAAG